VYFIANPRELDVPFVEFNRLLGYAANYRLHGFTSISSERLAAFYSRYDDLYSVLVRIKGGDPVAERPARPIHVPGRIAEEPPLADTGEILEAVSETRVVSDHTRMQWTLARLGIKAGERIWVPPGDQTRLQSAYDFNECDQTFTTGLDLPHSYVENIDVVWKQEYRIAAAYEVENSTAIYSGLLRFADLTILAPNTLYPMFIVARAARKGQVRDQLRRPAFQQLKLADKVLFLSYEEIDDIDQFFGKSASGLSVDLMKGKAELLT
jgi:hypothetical protein